MVSTSSANPAPVFAETRTAWRAVGIARGQIGFVRDEDFAFAQFGFVELRRGIEDVQGRGPPARWSGARGQPPRARPDLRFRAGLRIGEPEKNPAQAGGFLDCVARGAGTGLTIARSMPSSRLSRLDLPTFGRPTIATLTPSRSTARSPPWKKAFDPRNASQDFFPKATRPVGGGDPFLREIDPCLEVGTVSRIFRPDAGDLVAEPALQLLRAARIASGVLALMRSITASAWVRSSLPLKMRACVNSPAPRRELPAGSTISKICAASRMPPWHPFPPCLRRYSLPVPETPWQEPGPPSLRFEDRPWSHAAARIRRMENFAQNRNASGPRDSGSARDRAFAGRRGTAPIVSCIAPWSRSRAGRAGFRRRHRGPELGDEPPVLVHRAHGPRIHAGSLLAPASPDDQPGAAAPGIPRPRHRHGRARNWPRSEQIRTHLGKFAWK